MGGVRSQLAHSVVACMSGMLPSSGKLPAPALACMMHNWQRHEKSKNNCYKHRAAAATAASAT